jgi:hypothetical protein
MSLKTGLIGKRNVEQGGGIEARDRGASIIARKRAERIDRPG